MEQTRKPSTWHGWLIAGVLSLVAYPLSIGPAEALYWRCGLYNYRWSYVAFRLYYSPLVAITDSSPACAELGESYVKLWLDPRLGFD